ncbi:MULTISPECIES: 16S rRNA (uracil(1498)-N(3))-methyltransferase [unclassified Oceanispirochaeta]|uniref:RsmE family RNA methyltransferase n=1 Tax=unclassified Oceanispirochaeta TaxID=2635722 RepID=UPI001314EEA1|nr:RsmE family RNA methyltransferase [Oceanispirochaeta sp. M1]MBF9015253.1 16S rRNA (uracil(1498)-N(3))-methyltransferase [Oceanispirochaeta sp. M2]NPD71711.1 16S rRNA (uracil(1498)-N(3))-methyltransferase [Oceanispirochaeta sp. M1]
MKQFVCNQELKPGQTITLMDDEFHYLCRVRRSEKGDILELTDSASARFRARMLEIRNDECDILVEEELTAYTRQYELHLYLCLCKGKKQDSMIRQAVEAGVNSITLVDSQHSQVRFSGSEAHKYERWRKIIREARQQSGSPVNTELNDLISFTELPDLDSSSGRWGIFCHQEKIDGNPLSQMNSSSVNEVHLLIGSEGGLSNKEIEIMQKKGFSSLFLGYNVLRAETASIFALGTIISCMELI